MIANRFKCDFISIWEIPIEDLDFWLNGCLYLGELENGSGR